MFQIDNDMTIYITRGDVAYFTVTADNNGEKYMFQPGDVVRIKVFAKKDAANVAFQKDFPVLEEAEKVDILLTEEETKIGDVISKPVDYWYEIELNPYTNPQTIIGYDDDGAKIFRLFPEGRDLNAEVEEEDIPVLDTELSMTSNKPVENQAITAAMVRLLNEIAIERGRISKLANGENITDTLGIEVTDIRVGVDGKIYSSAGNAVRGQIKEVEKLFTMPTQDAVDKWLSEHPEATTTVQDGSLTEEKIHPEFLLHINNYYVTPQMFGAVGDGVTDDTVAFQLACASGYDVFIPTSKNEIYILDGKIEVKEYVRVYSEPSSGQWDVHIIFRSGGFELNRNCVVSGLAIKGVENLAEQSLIKTAYYDGTFLDNPGGSECIIENCSFNYGGSAIESRGRADIIRNNHFYRQYKACVLFNYTYDGTNGSDVQQPSEGFRGVMVYGNRIHVCYTFCRIDNGEMVGAIITENSSDYNTGILVVNTNAKFRFGVIANNTCLNCNHYVIQNLSNLENSFEHNTIKNNVFTGYENGDCPEFILCNKPNTMNHTVIEGNTFKKCSRQPIHFASCMGAIISNNTFKEICTNVDYHKGAIYFEGDLSYVSIVGNTCVNDEAIPYFISHTTGTTPTLTGCNITGNSNNCLSFIEPSYYEGTKANVIQEI